jgi:hypothetical protein
MGLFLRFGSHPTPLHVADNSLPAIVDVDVDVDVLDRDLLLAFAAMTVQRLSHAVRLASTHGRKTLPSAHKTGTQPTAGRIISLIAVLFLTTTNG